MVWIPCPEPNGCSSSCRSSGATRPRCAARCWRSNWPRTLYRDIASLQAQGAHIEGEPGLGYLLRPGFLLPPLMFTEDEIEALVLGSRWVAERADADLAEAARSVTAKVAAVIPAELRRELEASSLLIGPTERPALGDAALAQIRRAIRASASSPSRTAT
ncbi:HTH domain-containing protein [Geothrix sp. PMB-07]|nr:HTH domain-containing protein [Geothrix sp. PMB-07]WLT31857.1 HTH domain-containing protein [Geothrix sp. PMB-07]